MGFTGLARWINAPTTGLELIRDNIIKNHHGLYRGKWLLNIRSYRSTFGGVSGLHVPSERSMCALTMNDNVFVLLEDPSAPTRADILQIQINSTKEQEHLGITLDDTSNVPPHYRTTFLTLSPPGALEQLMAQLRARWISVRQTTAGGRGGQRAHGSGGNQLIIDGYIFAIGHDWLVRAGNVVLAGGAVKGMLLEAEYLPLPVLHSQTADGTSELLSNLLTSVLPNIRDAKTVAVTISDAQWEEVLWDREEEEGNAVKQTEAETPVSDADDNIHVFSEDNTVGHKKGDWVGIDRDRRSAFLIIGALKSEGIL